MSNLPPRARARNFSTSTRRKIGRANGPAEVAAAILVGGLVVAAVVGLIGLIVVLSGLLTLLAWNVGVVGIAAALGTKVATISLGVAICANFAISVISRIFRGPTKVTTGS
jgi:hypothetical protein